MVVYRRLYARHVHLVFAFQTRTRLKKKQQQQLKQGKQGFKNIFQTLRLHSRLSPLSEKCLVLYFSCFNCQSKILHCATGFCFFHGLWVFPAKLTDFPRTCLCQKLKKKPWKRFFFWLVVYNYVYLQFLQRGMTSTQKPFKLVNKLLNKFCNQHEWKLIRHFNISDKHLNRGGLHLTRQGSDLL